QSAGQGARRHAATDRPKNVHENTLSVPLQAIPKLPPDHRNSTNGVQGGGDADISARTRTRTRTATSPTRATRAQQSPGTDRGQDIGPDGSDRATKPAEGVADTPAEGREVTDTQPGTAEPQADDADTLQPDDNKQAMDSKSPTPNLPPSSGEVAGSQDQPAAHMANVSLVLERSQQQGPAQEKGDQRQPQQTSEETYKSSAPQNDQQDDHAVYGETHTQTQTQTQTQTGSDNQLSGPARGDRADLGSEAQAMPLQEQHASNGNAKDKSDAQVQIEAELLQSIPQPPQCEYMGPQTRYSSTGYQEQPPGAQSAQGQAPQGYQQSSHYTQGSQYQHMYTQHGNGQQAYAQGAPMQGYNNGSTNTQAPPYAVQGNYLQSMHAAADPSQQSHLMYDSRQYSQQPYPPQPMSQSHLSNSNTLSRQNSFTRQQQGQHPQHLMQQQPPMYTNTHPDTHRQQSNRSQHSRQDSQSRTNPTSRTQSRTHSRTHSPSMSAMSRGNSQTNMLSQATHQHPYNYSKASNSGSGILPAPPMALPEPPAQYSHVLNESMHARETGTDANSNANAMTGMYTASSNGVYRSGSGRSVVMAGTIIDRLNSGIQDAPASSGRKRKASTASLSSNQDLVGTDKKSRNREAARRCRQKKNNKLVTLPAAISVITDEIADLRRRQAVLQAEKQKLEAKLFQHTCVLPKT
ncbi:hypothetical protein SARC_08085, partial [Sphaeroforma arctica JP610]